MTGLSIAGQVKRSAARGKHPIWVKDRGAARPITHAVTLVRSTAMANVFKRAALAFGRWTGLRREVVEGDPQLALIDPVAREMTEFSQPAESSIDTLIERSGNEPELPPLDAPRDLWGDAFEPAPAIATQDSEAAIATGQIGEPASGAIDLTPAAPDQPTTA